MADCILATIIQRRNPLHFYRRCVEAEKILRHDHISSQKKFSATSTNWRRPCARQLASRISTPAGNFGTLRDKMCIRDSSKVIGVDELGASLPQYIGKTH